MWVAVHSLWLLCCTAGCCLAVWPSALPMIEYWHYCFMQDLIGSTGTGLHLHFWMLEGNLFLRWRRKCHVPIVANKRYLMSHPRRLGLGQRNETAPSRVISSHHQFIIYHRMDIVLLLSAVVLRVGGESRRGRLSTRFSLHQKSCVCYSKDNMSCSFSAFWATEATAGGEIIACKSSTTHSSVHDRWILMQNDGIRKEAQTCWFRGSKSQLKSCP